VSEGGGLIVDGAEEVLDHAFTVNRNGEGRGGGGINMGVMVWVVVE
jgi:hypothetical protein